MFPLFLRAAGLPLQVLLLLRIIEKVRQIPNVLEVVNKCQVRRVVLRLHLLIRVLGGICVVTRPAFLFRRNLIPLHVGLVTVFILLSHNLSSAILHLHLRVTYFSL